MNKTIIISIVATLLVHHSYIISATISDSMYGRIREMYEIIEYTENISKQRKAALEIISLSDTLIQLDPALKNALYSCDQKWAQVWRSFVDLDQTKDALEIRVDMVIHDKSGSLRASEE